MSDIDAAHRPTLTRFGVYQMNNNPAGIGNECTHWIYAALFESRALDRDRRLHIQQAGVPYTWGVRVGAAGAQRGDIAQFHGFQTNVFIYLDSHWMTHSFIRGPNHTGMVFIAPRSGAYYQLESHLHQPGTPVMSIRGNTIYYESFAIALTATEFASVKGASAWPASVDTTDINDLLERVDWVGMRDDHSITLHDAEGQIARVMQRRGTPRIKGNDIAVLFRIRASGQLRFYRPQESIARLGMSADQLQTDKADLVHRMIRGGRAGHAVSEDEYGGDNKRQRVHDHRFDWTFPQP